MPSIDKIWQEYTVGIDGWLLLTLLNEVWGARWKRNINSVKVEYSRRQKVVKLINELSNRMSSSGWTADDILAHLRNHFPIDPQSTFRHLHTSWAFMDYLQKKGALESFADEVVATMASNAVDR